MQKERSASAQARGHESASLHVARCDSRLILTPVYAVDLLRPALVHRCIKRSKINNGSRRANKAPRNLSSFSPRSENARVREFDHGWREARAAERPSPWTDYHGISTRESSSVIREPSPVEPS